MAPLITIGRRGFLSLAGSALVGATGASRWPALAAELPPHDVGRKFYADGRVKPFAGNTIISHLPQQGRNSVFLAMLDIYRQLPSYRFSHKITPTPPSSYHMTVFGGATDTDRVPGLWPKDVPRDAPIAECNKWVGDRLSKFKLDTALPFRMRVDKAEANLHEAPITIRLLPADEIEAKKLSALRDRLSDTLGIRGSDHDRYRFHITLAYLIQRLTEDEKQEYSSALARWRDVVDHQLGVFEIGAPEYCIFRDMFAFNRQFYFS